MGDIGRSESTRWDVSENMMIRTRGVECRRMPSESMLRLAFRLTSSTSTLNDLLRRGKSRRNAVEVKLLRVFIVAKNSEEPVKVVALILASLLRS